MIIAAKCAPKENTLSDISKAGLGAVELYLSKTFLKDVPSIVRMCGNFPLRYAIHAPNDVFAMEQLAELSVGISAEVMVFHNIYWEDEWNGIAERFKDLPARLCVENTYSAHEPVKFMRRYGMGRCLDLEHLQMECCGLYEEVFVEIMREASHVHLTGYTYGSELWHTHIHYSPEHGANMLDLLKKADYRGFVVSEARASQHTYADFRKLQKFYENWEEDRASVSKERSDACIKTRKVEE